MPYNVDRIMEIANKYEIPVIEDAAEGFGSRYNGQVFGTFGQYGVLSFNGNKMITTSGGGALVCPNQEAKDRIMFFATQAREAYPYYQHEEIGYNYRMSNICAGIGRGQMTIVNDHIRHHQHVQSLYAELFKEVKGISVHSSVNPLAESNFWLCTILLDEELPVKGQEIAYQQAVNQAIGGAAAMIHSAGTIHTDCEPNVNVEAMRLGLNDAGIEARPLWKPMHKQPIFAKCEAYTNKVSESLFAKGLCLPSGPWVSDEDVRYVVDTIKSLIL
jgi:dTDP-4-amino-4,6-dideoxygalactose transaminase